jgi:hypothetical protein
LGLVSEQVTSGFPFFFFGLRFPTALISGALTVASFLSAAISFARQPRMSGGGQLHTPSLN